MELLCDLLGERTSGHLLWELLSKQQLCFVGTTLHAEGSCWGDCHPQRLVHLSWERCGPISLWVKFSGVWWHFSLVWLHNLGTCWLLHAGEVVGLDEMVV